MTNNRSKAQPITAAPKGHRRAIDVVYVDQIRIRCECGWSSFILPQAAAERSYDAHLRGK